MGLYDDARETWEEDRESRNELLNDARDEKVIVSSSTEESLSLIAISFGNPVLNRSSGLVIVADGGVPFTAGEGVAGVREVDAMGDDGGEYGTPSDITRRVAGAAASTDEGGVSR